MGAGFSSRSLGFNPRCFFFLIYTTTHCSLLKLIVRSGLDVPTFATRRHHVRAPSGGRWNCGREMSGKFCLNADFHVTFRDLLHATDGFTSPPKEGALRIYSVGFDRANLGTKGQHTTSRPPKPLSQSPVTSCDSFY